MQAVREIAGGLDDDEPPADESFLLREALNAPVMLLRPQAEARGLELTVVLDPRLPHVCRGVPSRLRRLLTCLIDSAIAQATAIPVAVTATLAEREPGEPRLRLGVRGDVISDAMGRAIVTALATDLGGTIAFDSDGATAELPLVRDEAAAVEPNLTGRKVAIVTIDRDLADRLRIWLGGWGPTHSGSPRLTRRSLRWAAHRSSWCSTGGTTRSQP